MECEDFLEFQDVLQKMRDVDDKIVYTFNTSIPTVSFRNEINPTNSCKELFSKLTSNYELREEKIKGCVKVVADTVKQIKELREKNAEDVTLLKKLKKEQNKLRLLQTELNVEEVIRDRTLRLFSEKCRQFYKPPRLQPV